MVGVAVLRKGQRRGPTVEPALDVSAGDVDAAVPAAGAQRSGSTVPVVAPAVPTS